LTFRQITVIARILTSCQAGSAEAL